ncbi:MAG: hypothetical protein DMG73_04100 [Acidobacteria bacterium]|nr:MAG: hypothetical protein DMG73_04100 [Acidobacteriota bacterium]PYX65215.1 MAG: hypothetical protein DMG74_09655 [Acidobacteriota bacterium]
MPVPGLAGPLLFTTKTARKLLESGGVTVFGITIGRNVSPQLTHTMVESRTVVTRALHNNVIGTPPQKLECSLMIPEEFPF